MKTLEASEESESEEEINDPATKFFNTVKKTKRKATTEKATEELIKNPHVDNYEKLDKFSKRTTKQLNRKSTE